MHNAKEPVISYTVWSRKKHYSEYLEGWFDDPGKITETQHSSLEDVSRFVREGDYSTVDNYYAVSTSHGNRVTKVTIKWRWRLPDLLKPEEEYATHVVRDNWGKYILPEELREAYRPLPRRYYGRRWNSHGKTGGRRYGYLASNIGAKKRLMAIEYQEPDYFDLCGSDCEICDEEFYDRFWVETRVKSRKKADNFEFCHWGDPRKGQRTNWKHHRKTQYKPH